MSEINYSNIENFYNSYLERDNSNVSLAEKSTGSVFMSSNNTGGSDSANNYVPNVNTPEPVINDGQLLENLWINSWIKSKNYSPKSKGFLIDGQAGYIECMALYVGSGGIVGGSLDIPNTTTANSFHVNTIGHTWWGCSNSSFNADPNNAVAYVLNTGVAHFSSISLDTDVVLSGLQPGSSLAIQYLTAGSITSKAITLAVSEGSGDSYIAAGKTDFTNAESGFILGIDDSDSNKTKFLIGSSTSYLNFITGSALGLRGVEIQTGEVGGTQNIIITSSYIEFSDSSLDSADRMILHTNQEAVIDFRRSDLGGGVVSTISVDNTNDLLHWNTSYAGWGFKLSAINGITFANKLLLDPASGDNEAIEIDQDQNSATDSVGIKMAVDNAGAGTEFAFQFAGSEYSGDAVRVKTTNGTRYIPLNSTVSGSLTIQGTAGESIDDGEIIFMADGTETIMSRMESTAASSEQDFGYATATFTDYFTQSFEFNRETTVTYIRLRLKKTLTPADNINITLYATTASAGYPTGDALATGSIAGTTITASLAYYDIALSTSVTFTADSWYMFKIERSGAGDDSNNYAVDLLDSTNSNFGTAGTCRRYLNNTTESYIGDLYFDFIVEATADKYYAIRPSVATQNRIDGICNATTVKNGTFAVVIDGVKTKSAWGLTKGTKYYMGSTIGSISTIPSTKFVGRGMNTTDILLSRLGNEPSQLMLAEAGTTAKSSANTEATTTENSYTKLKEIQTGISGVITVYFEMYNSGDGTSYGRIYKNGAAVGTEQSTVSGSWQTYSQNLTFVKNDLIQIYAYNNSTGEVGIRNFQLKYNTYYYNDVVNLD